MRTTLHSTLLYNDFAMPEDGRVLEVGTTGNAFTPTIDGELQQITFQAPPAYTSPYYDTIAFGALDTTRSGTSFFQPRIATGIYEMKIEDVSGWFSFNYGSFNTWISADLSPGAVTQPTATFIGPGSATMSLKFRDTVSGAVVGAVTLSLTAAT